MVLHQSDCSVDVPPLSRTAAAARRLTSAIPLTSGDDLHVPEWPTRHVQFTFLCAQESKTVFDDTGLPHIWQNLRRDIKQGSFTMIFFPCQSLMLFSSDDDVDVGVTHVLGWKLSSASPTLLKHEPRVPGLSGDDVCKTKKRFLFNCKDDKLYKYYSFRKISWKL